MQLLTTKKMADILHITSVHLNTKAKAGLIPYYDICGSFRFNPEEVLKALRVGNSLSEETSTEDLGDGVSQEVRDGILLRELDEDKDESIDESTPIGSGEGIKSDHTLDNESFDEETWS